MNTSRPGLSYRDPHRSALLGAGYDTPSPSGSGRASPYYGDYAANRTAEDLEGQNDEHLEGLSAKVKLLKEITVNIGAEVRDSTKMLNSMNDSFSEAGGLLTGTFKRMNKMARRQGGQFCLWMAFLGICVTVFFWTWLWRR